MVNMWVWIVIGALIVMMLIRKYWPSFNRSGRLVAIDAKTGGLLVVKKSKKPYWLMYIVAGVLIAAIVGGVMLRPWRYLTWENHTANIESLPSEKNASFEVVNMQTRNNFEADEIKFFDSNEMWEIPVGKSINETIILNFTGPTGRWSYSVCKKGDTVYYHEITKRSDWIQGRHTIRPNKSCTLFLTKTKPKMVWN